MTDALIMGIDPGLANTGWGVVRQRGTRLVPVAYGCISTTKDRQLPWRLAVIHDNLCEIIDRYHPQDLSVEGIYFGENAKSAMLTAQARGAALVACAYKGLQYAEYTPMQIKQTVVGTGGAAKEQVQYMVKAILELEQEPKPDHAADALAAAITHARLRGLRRLELEDRACKGSAGAKAAKSKFDERVAAALARDGRKERAR